MVTNKSLLKQTRIIITGLIILFALLYIFNPPQVQKVILAFGILLVITLLVFYRNKRYEEEVEPLSFKGLLSLEPNSFGRSFLAGFLAVVGFWLVAKVFPGFSIGIPSLPASIGDNFRFITIVFLAPICEELFFRSGVKAFLEEDLNLKKRIILAVFIGAIIFSLAHLGAYLTGLFEYPDLPDLLNSFGQNIGSFIAAGVFGLVAGFLVMSKNLTLISPIVFHMGVNFLIINPFTLIF